uniref:Uncharacterized protein n=1 Tax=Oryza sativa subsp. indica TaxID=39946 RepID=A0A679B9J0_ORYSI|nr:hypothetical protein [Oryza sativa Indica Group]BBD82415.1 hypothetical protein [Oryza sativa Indica Group]
MARCKGRRRPATVAASDRFHPSLTDFAIVRRPPLEDAATASLLPCPLPLGRSGKTGMGVDGL